MNELKFQQRMQREQLDSQDEMQDKALVSEDASRLKMYAPQLMEQMGAMQAAVIAQTDPVHEADQLILEFQGKEIVNGAAVQVRAPILNEKGICYIAPILRTFAIQSSRLARIKNKQVTGFTLALTNAITENLGLKWEQYELAPLNRDALVIAIGIFANSILSRAEDQNEKNWLGKITFENLNPATGKKPKESFLDKFKLGGS